MFPFNEYALVRERQEELLRQAANERLLRASQDVKALYRTLVLWLGMHMVEWGKKLERLGEVKPVCPSSTLPGSIDA